ncbi:MULTISPECIES: ASCH domain-containing protein [unclassified Ornithinimicrobium]|uniref:ASCH domain-containing protein n=1 Tax=unclassified Ornithinimicrobium TaxID=2615080 RepID=UPI003853E4C5
MDDDREIRDFWTDARIRGGLNPASAYLGSTASDTLPPPAWSFGDTAEVADRLLALVLEGRKTATASARWEYAEDALRGAPGAGRSAEGDLLVRAEIAVDLPRPGGLSIVLDGAGVPRALIRTTRVQVVRFGEVDEEHARREGEGSLDEWRAVHRAIFASTAPPGQEVTDDTLVVLERFVVVVPASARRAAKRNGLG